MNTSLREAEVHVALSRLYMKLAANKKNDEEAAAGDTSAACTPNKPPQPVPDNSAEKHEKAKRGGNILKLALKDMAYIITISNASRAPMGFAGFIIRIFCSWITFKTLESSNDNVT